MRYKETLYLLFRYVFLLVLGVFGFYLIYDLFTPLTLYPSYFVIKIFYPSTLINPDSSILIVNREVIRIVEACVAGAAYYLLLLLNLSTPMSLSTRIKSVLFMFFSFLVINIVRIAIFTSLFVSGFSFFDLAHKLVWYLGSTLLVVLIWFANVYLFKLSNIPFYSDVLNLSHDIYRRKR